MQNNLFNFPRTIRKLVLDNVKVIPKIKFEGKGFICALINSRCHIGCSHCMFSSNMDEQKNEFNTMTPTRVEKLMNLVKDSNTSYLLVSGGGESFLEPSLMFQIVEKSMADLTWMVTSAFWAKNKSKADEMLHKLYQAYLKGNILKVNRRICIRVSFDNYHVSKLSKHTKNPFDYIINIIEAFESTYSEESGFFLQLHCIEGEEKLVEKLKEEISAIKISEINSIHNEEKITESAITLQLLSGYKFEVTFAKLLYSDMVVDLRDTQLLEKRINIWERDAFINEKSRAGYKIDSDGLFGNDMLVIYDGRVSGAWQCESSDVLINIDTDSYTSIVNKTIYDPNVLATLENGHKYRFNIIDEVCPKASLRAKAVNIRDYTSPILFEEDTVQAYYTIRVIQDYFQKGEIEKQDIDNYPRELKELIFMSTEELQLLYKESNYDIIKQFEETELGFDVFIKEVRTFANTGNYNKLFKELSKNNLFYLDKWRILLKRIIHEWYDIKSLSANELSVLNEIEQLIDLKLLFGRRIYDGLITLR